MRYSFSLQKADDRDFKVRRSVTPSCPKHHKMKGHDLDGTKICDICNSQSGTTWRCPRRGCSYDLCSGCKDKKSSRRCLLPATKMAIYNAMPNLDVDPYENNDGGHTWAGLYVVEFPGVSIRDIALDVKVSLGALIDNNDGIGLTTTSRLRKGTTLWIPGASGTRRAGPRRGSA